MGATRHGGVPWSPGRQCRPATPCRAVSRAHASPWAAGTSRRGGGPCTQSASVGSGLLGPPTSIPELRPIPGVDTRGPLLCPQEPRKASQTRVWQGDLFCPQGVLKEMATWTNGVWGKVLSRDVIHNCLLRKLSRFEVQGRVRSASRLTPRCASSTAESALSRGRGATP